MKALMVDMPDGSRWAVPADVIARNRDKSYGGDDDLYLETLENDDELEDWAVNNMDWADVKALAFMVRPPEPVDYEDGWINGDKEVAEVEPSTDEAADIVQRNTLDLRDRLAFEEQIEKMFNDHLTYTRHDGLGAVFANRVADLVFGEDD